MERRKVHVTYPYSDRLRYSMLWDDGTDVLRFDSGSGFLHRSDLEREGAQVRDGWPNA